MEGMRGEVGEKGREVEGVAESEEAAGREVEEYKQQIEDLRVRALNMYIMRPKKTVRTCAKSTVAAVHINSRKNIFAYAHMRTIRVSNSLYKAICVQRMKSSQSLVCGAAVVEAWVY